MATVVGTGRTSSFVLADGRRLGYHEYGAPGGLPCIYTPGTPSSGLAGAAYDEAARAAGVRWVSVDKPGYGQSDFQHRRTLLGYADDIARLADHLGLDRFAVAGESGGGPHALALGHELPARITVAIVLAGMGPASERWVRAGMKPANRRLVAVAHRAPWALRVPMALMRRTLRDDKRVERLIRQQMAHAVESDRRVMAELSGRIDLAAAARDAFRNDSRGAAQEMALFARPWGFDPAAIACQVALWHGTEDVNVPVAVAERMAALIPHCTAHLLPGEGHAVGLARRADVMASVVRAGQVQV